jgi:hypothetical protein
LIIDITVEKRNIFLGDADYVSHSGSKPISFVWKLKEPIPASLLPKANKSVAI